MPVINGEYQTLDKDEIAERLKQAFKEELGTETQPGDLVTKQLEAEAETLAQNQEQALERVYQAAYLADATGKELDKVVDVIGLNRFEATPSTGTVRLWRETPPSTSYTIQRGSLVQTADANPREFSITEQDKLALIDSFEEGKLTEWEGDTTSFTVVNDSSLDGNYVLELPATSGPQITTTDTSFGIGATFTGKLYLPAGSIVGFRFGLQDQSNYFECQIDEPANDLTLRLIESGAESSKTNNGSANVPSGTSIYFEAQWGLYEDNTVTLYESEQRDSELCSVSLSDRPKWEEGAISLVSLDGNTTKLVDDLTTRAALCNVRAVDAGVDSNLGPNTINTITNGITGVEKVTNPVATGDPNHVNTNFSQLTLGENRETDKELRERAYDSTSIGGAASVNAIGTELRRVDGVKSVKLNRNRENTSVNGLPAHSFEAVVYGGSDKAVAETIFETASIDSNDVGGVNGTAHTYTITSSITKDDETIEWSRPDRLDLNITLELIVDDTFVGETEIRDRVVDYIGGTGVNGEFVNGLNVGEDVYEAVLKRRLIGPDETGVWEVNSLTIDSNNDGTDDTTTLSSGADVLKVASNKVAITNARDSSITVNTTQK